MSQQPPRMCYAMSDVPGNHVHIDGHIALVPIHIPYPDGSIARSNDPLPLPSTSSLRMALDRHELEICTLGLSNMLVWHYISVVCRCVDKGVGGLWAFCRHWMWSVLRDFLRDEGCIRAAIHALVRCRRHDRTGDLQ